MLKRVSCLILGLVLLHAPASGALYQWVDEKGGVHFSDQPQPPPARAAASPVPADKPLARSFPLPRHGTLILSVPESWGQEIRVAPEGLPPTVVLTPRAGDDFEVLVTPLWSPRNEPGFNNPEATRRLVADSLARMLPTAVERDVPLQELRGKSGAGYYFIVTDKAPGKGYRYAAIAGIGVGDLWLVVTVLCRTRDSEGLRQTLLALQGAEHKKG